MSSYNVVLITLYIVTSKYGYLHADVANSQQGSIEKHPNLALLPESCGSYSVYYTIPGRNALLGEFSWMALISYHNDAGFIMRCSGTVISPKYVLTSAYCAKDEGINVVRVGEHNVQTETDCELDGGELLCEENVQDLVVEKIIVHENYVGMPNFENNIALLRLKEPVNLTIDSADAVCLPVTEKLINRNALELNGIISGWELERLDVNASVLHRAVASTVNPSVCGEIYKRTQETMNKDLCIGGKKSDCVADSGSPLTIVDVHKGAKRYIQYGISSQGPLACEAQKATLFTDVSKYVGWILDHMEP